MKRISTLMIALGLIAVLLSACGSQKKASAPAATGEQKKVYEIKTWSRSDCTDAPFIVAEKKGFFEEEGIKIVYTGETQPPQRIASILNGNNDVGTAHPNTIAIAREGGAPIRGVARSIIEPPAGLDDIHLQHMWWVTDKNGPYKTWDDIKKATDAGKKIKVQLLLRNACIDFLTDIILEKYKINKNNIEYITMPDIEGVAALKTGRVDIITPHPTFYKATEDTGITNILITSREVAGENSGTYLYYFADKFLNDAGNKDAVKHFVTAIKKAERWANDNPEQTAKWTEEAIGVPVQANHYYARNAVIHDDQIQVWIDGSIKSGALPADTKVTVKDVITHEFDQLGNE